MSQAIRPSKPEPPYCWQTKAALRRIREALDADKAVASGLGVYVALTEIASDMQKNSFETTHARIGEMSGLSPRTVQQRIQDLVEIGVLECKVPPLRAPATYTLLAFKSKPAKQPLPSVKKPLLNDVQQNHNDSQPLPSVMQRTKKASLPTLEESSEESKKNKTKNPNSVGVASELPKMNAKAERLIYLIDLCEAVLGKDEMKNFHARWLERAETSPAILESVLSETRHAKATDKIKTTPARYAEDLWWRLNSTGMPNHSQTTHEN